MAGLNIKQDIIDLQTELDNAEFAFKNKLSEVLQSNIVEVQKLKSTIYTDIILPLEEQYKNVKDVKILSYLNRISAILGDYNSQVSRVRRIFSSNMYLENGEYLKNIENLYIRYTPDTEALGAIMIIPLLTSIANSLLINEAQKAVFNLDLFKQLFTMLFGKVYELYQGFWFLVFPDDKKHLDRINRNANFLASASSKAGEAFQVLSDGAKKLIENFSIIEKLARGPAVAQSAPILNAGQTVYSLPKPLSVVKTLRTSPVVETINTTKTKAVSADYRPANELGAYVEQANFSLLQHALGYLIPTEYFPHKRG